MSHASESDQSLSEQLAAEMARLWRLGERPSAEDFLDRHLELWDQPEAAADLIYEEICLRQQEGDTGAAADALRRFPQWRTPLEMLLRFHRILEPGPRAAAFPAPGETLGEFTLLAELGRGACGRVFLASQPSLADRLVVLKVTPRDGEEHLCLARLQHTNIVPLHGAHDDVERGLRVLCMPYFGGVTLARLLMACADRPFHDRTGRLLAELDRDHPPGSLSLPSPTAARHFLARASYAQAICALGAQLADGLHYAHEHGLIHLDVKPSNILLAASGQPMLLDFHLSREPIRPDRPALPWLGGTLQYMSPEQRLALAAIQAGRPIPVGVDGASDQYSLGLVLYEALGGSVPPTDSPPRLERSNPQVSLGLADIIHKCLAPLPSERYASADLLAADLRRHLADQPLRGVANRSLAERWRKWRRRKPHAARVAALGAAVVLLVLAVAVGGAGVLGARRAEVRGLMDQGIQHREQGRHALAALAFQHAQSVADGLPWQDDLTRELSHCLADQRHLVEWTRTAQELHAFVDRIRFLYSAPSLPPSSLDGVVADCSAWWDRRHQLTDATASKATPVLRRQVADDLLDLAILWTDLCAHPAAPDRDGAAQAALRVLSEVERQFGSSCVLERQRQKHAATLGLNELARQAELRSNELAPRTAWEFYAQGRSYLRTGELDTAAVALRQAVALQPDGLWPNFYDGVCAFQRGRFDDAVAAFSACVPLAPGSAECLCNRGLAYARLGRLDRAMADFDHALELTPTLADASLSRGTVHFQEKRFEQAALDFRQALTSGADPASVHFNLALIYQARNDCNAARRSLEQALQHNPQHKAALDLANHLKALQ